MGNNVLSLFSGAGGAVEGFEQAGYSVVAAVDYTDYATDTLRRNHKHVQVIKEDLGAISPEAFSEKHGIDADDIDVVSGGPPCQGFSKSGKRDPHDERSELVTDFIGYVRYFNPDSVIMENVEGICTISDGAVMEYVYDSLEEMEYSVTHSILDASNYRVPQRRKRAFFVATKTGEYTWPEKYDTVVTVRDAFALVNEEHDNHVGTAHREPTTERIRNTEPGEAIYDSFNKNQRLRWDHPSPTLLAGGESGAWQYGHPSKPRSLTIHERALLQSFPVTYVFSGSIGEQRILTGNAVPPNMIRELAKQL